MAAETVTAISSLAELEALAAGHTFVVVDFWAEWCGPCKAISPMFAKLAAAHATPGKLAFAKVDVDDQPEVAQKYSITAMPSFLFLEAGQDAGVELKTVQGGGALKDGDKVKMIRGADPKNLVAAITEIAEKIKGEAAA